MLKKLLLVGAIIAIIPLEREKQADLYQAAKSTIADITGFCFRNPGVCEKGNDALDKLATKAEFGARMMVDIAREQSGPKTDELALVLKATNLQPRAARARAAKPLPAQGNERFPSYRDNQYNEHFGTNSNTLSASDLQPGWQGGSRR